MTEQQKTNYFENVSTERAGVLAGTAAFLAVLFVVCFGKEGTLPQVALPIFCAGVAAAILWITQSWGLIVNKKAILWLLPIACISSFNGIFAENLFTYGNIVVLHLLFAAFCLSLTGGSDVFQLQSLSKIFTMIIGHWFSFALLFKKFGLHRANGAGNSQKYKNALKIVVGLLIAFPVVSIIALLLLSADAVFQFVVTKLTDHLLQWDAGVIRYVIMGILVFIYVIGYTYNTLKMRQSEDRAYKPLLPDSVISITFLGCINLLFLGFVFVQIAFLFNGGFMKLPDGIIYSEYAREGFFQLLFVTCINFAVIIFFTMLADIKKQPIVRLMLLVLCVFTLVLVVSSFYRMNLYIQAYGYTTLRNYVLTFLTMEVFLLMSTVLFLYKQHLNLYKSYLLIGILFYAIVNVTGSDYVVTQLNINRFLNDPHAYVDTYSTGRNGDALVAEFYQSREEFQTGAFIVTEGKIRRTDGLAPLQTETLVFEEEQVSWQSWSLLRK